MISRFSLNGIKWKVLFVAPTSSMLIDRTNNLRLATTDPTTHCIYISSSLNGNILAKVLLHELGHCAMFSYNLLDDIHSVLPPSRWIEAEEWVCNFIADYGRQVFSIAYDILGDDAWLILPHRLEKLVS